MKKKSPHNVSVWTGLSPHKAINTLTTHTHTHTHTHSHTGITYPFWTPCDHLHNNNYWHTETLSDLLSQVQKTNLTAFPAHKISAYHHTQTQPSYVIQCVCFPLARPSSAWFGLVVSCVSKQPTTALHRDFVFCLCSLAAAIVDLCCCSIFITLWAHAVQRKFIILLLDRTSWIK